MGANVFTNFYIISPTPFPGMDLISGMGVSLFCLCVRQLKVNIILMVFETQTPKMFHLNLVFLHGLLLCTNCAFES